MPVADPLSYLSDIVAVMKKHWPDNRTINIVCHGHSVPAGYFATPMVDTFNAYPHLLHAGLKARFPYAVINVIVTAIGGENSIAGAKRFATEVLCHHPDVITIDYGLNDRRAGLEQARASWTTMIQQAQSAGSKVILLTPTADCTQDPAYQGSDKDLLPQHADQIRQMAGQFNIGLADSYAAFRKCMEEGALCDLLSWPNHPNRAGHDLVARQLLRWFPAC